MKRLKGRAAAKMRRAQPPTPRFARDIERAIEHQEAGRLPQAEAIYRQILQSQPDHPEALHLLGVIAHQVGQYGAAAELIGRAVTLDSNYAEAHYNLGNALLGQGSLAEAVASYQRAIALRPDFPGTHYNLGNAYLKQGRLDDALLAYRQAITLNPNYAEAHYNLGNVCFQQDRLDDAVAAYRQAIALRPDYARAHNNLGSAFQQQGKPTEAIASYERAIGLYPEFAEAHYNLGLMLQQQGKLTEAIASYQQAIRFRPDYAEAHMNRALALLISGNFLDGWPEYEWRLLCQRKRRSSGFLDFPRPKWDGSGFPGKTLLVHAEQGIGDTIQFVRYVSIVKERGGRILLGCQPELRRLLDRFPGIDGLLDKPRMLDSDVSFDIHVPLMSLPGILGTDFDTIPSAVPYLKAPPELVEKWSERIDQEMFNVGIVWEGNPNYLENHNRSCSLQALAPLVRLSGVALYSLQKGRASAQTAHPPDGMRLVDYTVELNDFADTAALIVSLDLVISVDTAVAHLTGALGRPIWTLVMYSPDWRWFLDRTDTPWYPTMRLFRQPARGDWGSVVAKVAADLERVSRQRRRQDPECPHLAGCGKTISKGSSG